MKCFSTVVSKCSLAALLLGLICVSSLSVSARWTTLEDQSGASDLTYFCLPCGCADDGKIFKQPGICPACPMALVANDFEIRTRVARLETPPNQQRKVAILVFDDVQIIDYTGPFEVFGQANYQVYLVSKKQGEITTNMGMKIISDYGFDDCPPVDILLIPGGGVTPTQNDDVAIKWLKQKAEKTPHVISVCNGAFLLAKTGLLEGLSATTTAGLIEGLHYFAPKVKVVSDQRYVENGKFITTAGLSSGIDGSLYLVAKLDGLPRAQRIALGIEYNWNQDSSYARANFADRKILIPRLLSRDYYPLLHAPDTRWQVEYLGGSQDDFRLQWRVKGAQTAAQLLVSMREKLAKDGPWQEKEKRIDAKSAVSQWQFKDAEGRPWSAEILVKTHPQYADQLQVIWKLKTT